MSMKNDLINHINTKVSAPNMDYANLMKEGSYLLDKAFQPHKNTEQIISLDNHLQDIRKNQLSAMKDLATQEQNKMAIDVLNKKFEADSKSLNELGANLFTYGGTKLDGTEETYIQDIMKDFEKQTGRKDFNIDDVIRNVNDSQLALSSDLTDRINQYSDYKYNKAKIDNKILDYNDINKLAEEYYPQFGMMGQDQNSFKTLFSNNSNSFSDIVTDKAYRDAFKLINSDRDLDTERKEELIKKRLEQSQNSENEQSNNNKQVAKKSKTNQQNNNANTNTNQVDETQQSNIKTEEQIRADNIKFQNTINDIDDRLIRSNGNVQKMIELMGRDPVKQVAVVSKVLQASGMTSLTEDKLYEKIPVSTNFAGGISLEDKRFTQDYKFMVDLTSWAESGDILNFPLKDYDFMKMTNEGKEAYQIIERFQYFNHIKYNSLIDRSNEIAQNGEFSNQEILANRNSKNKKLELDYKQGKTLLGFDTNLENEIKNPQNGIFDLDNRELHNKGKDIGITATNNILKNISSPDEDIQKISYFLVTSDQVLEERLENFNNKNFSKLVKDPEKRKEFVRKIQIALSKAGKDVDSSLPIDMPNNSQLAEMIVLVDAMWSKNRKYYANNPAALYNLALEMYNKIHPDNIANSFNLVNNDESQVNNQK